MSSTPVLDEGKRIFFEAMQLGYAADGAYVTLYDGSHEFNFSLGKFALTDRYFTVNGSNYSAGSTTIFFGGERLWEMHYGGQYEEQAIPFLKSMMLRNYLANVFEGGRGPQRVIKEGFIYHNEMSANTFSQFGGLEYITTIQGDLVGYHSYFGFAYKVI